MFSGMRFLFGMCGDSQAAFGQFTDSGQDAPTDIGGLPVGLVPAV